MADIPVMRNITHEQLSEAFYPWVVGRYPDAKCIGDVVVAMCHQEEIVPDDYSEAEHE